MRNLISLGRPGLLLAVMACGGAAPPPSQGATNVSSSQGAKPAASAEPAPAEYQAIENAADRDPDDKKLDAGRKPAQFLVFVGVKPGNHVAELAAGGGYTTELLARAVGPTGVVYGQNSPWMLERFAKKPWEVRVAKPVNKNVVSVAREFEDPFPPEAKDLDAVVINLFYHDTFWLNVDRAKMNGAVHKALKPGGVYVVIDHSGRPGTGSTEVKTLHRIEEPFVRAEIEKAGFKLAVEGSFLRDPSDARDWNASPMAAGEKRGHSDRFALKFVKP